MNLLFGFTCQKCDVVTLNIFSLLLTFSCLPQMTLFCFRNRLVFPIPGVMSLSSPLCPPSTSTRLSSSRHYRRPSLKILESGLPAQKGPFTQTMKPVEIATATLHLKAGPFVLKENIHLSKGQGSNTGQSVPSTVTKHWTSLSVFSNQRSSLMMSSLRSKIFLMKCQDHFPNVSTHGKPTIEQWTSSEAWTFKNKRACKRQ